MKSKTLVDAGDSGSHTLTVGGKMVYRGFGLIATSTATGASVVAIVRDNNATGEIIDVHSFEGNANEEVDLHHHYEDEGVEVNNGIYIEVTVTSAVAGSVYGHVLFGERIP